MRLLDRLADHAARRPTGVAYRDVAAATTVTWAELHAAVRSRRAGGRVEVIRSGNTIDFAVAFLAALAGGRAAFPISPHESPAVVDAAVSRLGDVPLGREMLLLSSGSTGAAKIVRRSAAAIDAVCEQMVAAIGLTPADTVLATVPLCHSYGIEHGLLAPVWAGAAVTLCRGLDVPCVRSELAGGRATVLPGVPSVFEALARFGDPIAGVRAAYSAGGTLPDSVAIACRDQLGLPVGQVYGATEIGSVTYGDAADGSVGRPMPGVALRTDADGQVLVAAASLFDGYVGEPNPTTPGGFYPTGDLGHVDPAGRLHITGRARLLIDVGGRKVNPLEVELVLAGHPQVAACVVVPVAQTATVARLKAVVEPRRPGPPPDPEQLRAFARERLASYKVPRTVELRDALPRSPAGKILRQLVSA